MSLAGCCSSAADLESHGPSSLLHRRSNSDACLPDCTYITVSKQRLVRRRWSKRRVDHGWPSSSWRSLEWDKHPMPGWSPVVPPSAAGEGHEQGTGRAMLCTEGCSQSLRPSPGACKPPNADRGANLSSYKHKTLDLPVPIRTGHICGTLGL